jgi:hypothetical protein
LFDLSGDFDTAKNLPDNVTAVIKWARRLVTPAVAVIWGWWATLPWELKIPAAIAIGLAALALVNVTCPGSSDQWLLENSAGSGLL